MKTQFRQARKIWHGASTNFPERYATTYLWNYSKLLQVVPTEGLINNLFTESGQSFLSRILEKEIRPVEKCVFLTGYRGKVTITLTNRTSSLLFSQYGHETGGFKSHTAVSFFGHTSHKHHTFFRNSCGNICFESLDFLFLCTEDAHLFQQLSPIAQRAPWSWKFCAEGGGWTKEAPINWK